MSLDAYPLISDWITAKGGRLLVHSGKVDIGQRISTALVQIAHEELTVPHDRIDVAPVRTGHAPDEGITSGSNSVETSGHALRCAAASLRAALVSLAVRRWGGAHEDWALEDGMLDAQGRNQPVSILDLLADIPADKAVDPDATPRPHGAEGPADAMPRPAMRGMAAMVRGRFDFVQDLERPGMLHARVVRPPHARARLRALDEDAAQAMRDAGLSVVRDGSFLAVAGPREFPVIKAALRLFNTCTWDLGGGLPELDVFDRLNAEKAQRFLVVDGVPTDKPIPDAPPAPDHTARYERPYQMHGALAPSAALAEWDGDRLTLHSHSQGIYALRASIADSLGLEQQQVDITHAPGSGCYGHNGADDAAFEAALVAMALPGTPILLKWTRADEHCWEPFAPAMAVDLSARLRDGRIAAYSAEVFSDTHRGRPRPGPDRAGPGRLLVNRWRESPIGPTPATPNMGRHAGMHRNLDPAYTFADRRLVKNLVTGLPHRTSALRCLGNAANIFALESFVDEIARRQEADPIAFRKDHLDDPRAAALLDALRARLDKRPALPEGGGRGIAYAQYKNRMTRVGVAVDIEVNDRAEVRLLHATIVADAGRVIDADGLTAQLEGGFLQAASWALYEEVTWDRDGIQSFDWDSYPVLRFDNLPEIEVSLLNHPADAALGAGEASPGPSVAAIANAVFDATGLRLRRMPFTPDAIMQVAASA